MVYKTSRQVSYIANRYALWIYIESPSTFSFSFFSPSSSSFSLFWLNDYWLFTANVSNNKWLFTILFFFNTIFLMHVYIINTLHMIKRTISFSNLDFQTFQSNCPARLTISYKETHNTCEQKYLLLRNCIFFIRLALLKTRVEFLFVCN